MNEQIPEGWEVKRLGKVAKIYSGGTPSRAKPSYYLGLNPWVKSGEINQRAIKYTNEFISDEAIRCSSAKWADKGSILVAMYGATAGKVSKLMIDATINQAISAVCADNQNTTNDYLFHQIEFQSCVLLDTVQGSGQPNLSGQLVKELEVLLPPLPEQKKIAEILTSVDEVVEKTQAQINKLQDLKKGTMNQLLTRGIGHTEFKDSPLGKIPKSWGVKFVGDVGYVTKLAGYEYTEYFDYSIGGEIIALRALNLNNGKLDLSSIQTIPKNVSDKLPRSKLYSGDILISYVGSVGDIGFITADDKFHLAPNVAKIVSDHHKVCPHFLMHNLISEGTQRQILGLTTITSQPSLNMENIRKVPIVFPPLIEQKKIAEILTSIDKNIEEKQTKLEEIKALKKGLMQDLLTGKVRVTVN